MEPQDQSVTIDLHGSKATRGVELDGLERWLLNFRRALRDFERSQSPRREPVRRTGRPGPVSDVATAFRLVHFETGSGIATFEPVELPESDQLDIEAPVAPAIRNLRALVEAVDAGRVDPAVVEALNEARRAVGDDGHFGIRLGETRENGGTTIDSQTIERLEATQREDEPKSKGMTVSGRLHFIDVEEPRRVAVRDTSGIDWVCTYEPELEDTVLSLMRQIVWASGEGTRTSAMGGKMELRSIAPVPTYDQSSLFTFAPIPVEELHRQQGVEQPQGLAALSDPKWTDDEQDRAYLAFLLGDDSGE